MRRFVNGLMVVALAASLSAPAYAAPRRDDGGDRIYRDAIQKVAHMIKKVVKKLDDPKPIWPLP